MNSSLRDKPARSGRRFPKIAIAAIAVVILVWVCSYLLSRPVDPAPVLPSSAVEKADITQVVHAVGQLEPRLKVDVGAQVGGQVRKLHVQLGQVVKAGTLLVSLESESASNAVLQAEAALAQQAAALKRTRIDFDASRREAERQRRLLAGDATSALEKEQADIALDKLEADRQVQEATLEQRRADLVDRKLKLTYTSVTAPIDGEVVAFKVQEGQTVNALQSAPTLLTLAQLSTMTVKARVAEAEIGLIQAGQPVRVSTLAANGRRYEGKVRVVQPIPERIGNALFYGVLFEVDNADQELLSDMTVQVEIEVAHARQVPSVPILALGNRASDGHYTVQVVAQNNRASPRQVRIGVRDDGRVQVLDGLRLGERVLIVPPTTKLATVPSASR